MSAIFPPHHLLIDSLLGITEAPGPVRMIPRACDVYAHAQEWKIEDKVMPLSLFYFESWARHGQ